jgi:predicted metal-dependent HD superfamily phosphohydrolase
MQSAELSHRWQRLFPQRESSVLAKEWQCIESRYSEAHRHYHTLRHIAACLRWLDQLRDQIADPRTLELALWFHDFVYNPRRNDNEYISAEYAVSTLSVLREPKPVRDATRALIMVTRHPSRPVTPDQCWMVDIDLAILGAEPERYEAYAQQVRKEYAHVPDAAFAAGRKAVLESFLDEPNLYHTDYFRQHLESKARDNIACEIARL